MRLALVLYLGVSLILFRLGPLSVYIISGWNMERTVRTYKCSTRIFPGCDFGADVAEYCMPMVCKHHMIFICLYSHVQNDRRAHSNIDPHYARIEPRTS